jgi:hypothetical protein
MASRSTWAHGADAAVRKVALIIAFASMRPLLADVFATNALPCAP